MSGICSLLIGFEPDGSVKPCCEYSLEPTFYFGNILETNLSEILNGLKAQTFWNDRKIGDKLCDGCEWWDFCHGGCTYHRIQVDGSLTSKDHLCETYKDTFRRLTTRIDQTLLEGVGERAIA